MEYPYKALRESIINALIHRNYLGSSNIQTRVYGDCLIFMNEGKLPPEVPVDKLKARHLSRPGNKLLADIFYKAGFIESWGRGTVDILEACLKQGLPEPDFEAEYDVFNVILYKEKMNEGTREEIRATREETGEKIIQMITLEPTITMADLAKKIGLSEKGIEWNVKRLKENGILKRIGPTKGGRWSVVKEKSK